MRWRLPLAPRAPPCLKGGEGGFLPRIIPARTPVQSHGIPHRPPGGAPFRQGGLCYLAKVNISAERKRRAYGKPLHHKPPLTKGGEGGSLPRINPARTAAHRAKPRNPPPLCERSPHWPRGPLLLRDYISAEYKRSAYGKPLHHAPPLSKGG